MQKTEVKSSKQTSATEIFILHFEHDYSKIPNVIQLSCYEENVLTYISGYFVESVETETHCDVCKCALLAADDISPTKFALLNMKNRCGLKKASQAVIAVSEVTGKFVKHTISIHDGALPKGNNIVQTNIIMLYRMLVMRKHLRVCMITCLTVIIMCNYLSSR